MSIEALNYIENLMASINVPYEFMRWNSGTPPDCYFVGEYIENPPTTLEENGHQQTTFILRGFTRKDWMLLEEAKAKIKANVAKTAILDDGTGVAVFYDGATPVASGVSNVKSIKINLNIQEWKVN